MSQGSRGFGNTPAGPEQFASANSCRNAAAERERHRPSVQPACPRSRSNSPLRRDNSITFSTTNMNVLVISASLGEFLSIRSCGFKLEASIYGGDGNSSLVLPVRRYTRRPIHSFIAASSRTKALAPKPKAVCKRDLSPVVYCIG